MLFRNGVGLLNDIRILTYFLAGERFSCQYCMYYLLECLTFSPTSYLISLYILVIEQNMGTTFVFKVFQSFRQSDIV